MRRVHLCVGVMFGANYMWMLDVVLCCSVHFFKIIKEAVERTVNNREKRKT